MSQVKKGGKARLTPAQSSLAWKFQHTSPTMRNISDAARCLDDCFSLMKGEISDDEFRERTGHEPHGIRSHKKQD